MDQPGLKSSQTRLRVWPYLIILITLAAALGIRLTQLTIVEGSYRRGMAENNRTMAIRQTAPRGVLFDRNGEVLVHNVPFYKKQVTGTTIHQDEFEPITKEAALALANSGSGERVVYDIKREYTCGRACAPLLGYTAEVTAADLTANANEYVSGDQVGKSGLEKKYERQLRGIPGAELIEVSAMGQEVRTMGAVAYQPGQDLSLTLDKGLQTLLYEALEGKKGAAVAQIPQTGEVLAMVSSPAFDPNNLAGSLSEPDEPFFNRVIGGAYPPGSVFKVVTAIAALESGKVEEETQFDDSGEIVIGEYRYGNWLFDQYGRTEGKINIVRALQRSNDIFFYRAGETIGADKIAETAKLLGFGDNQSLLGLSAVTGTIPSPLWKEKTKGEKWFLGNTYHMAIGQGDVLTTPLQINRMMATVAAGGVLCPVVFSRDEVGKASCTQLNFKDSTLSVVKDGLKKACEAGGTGVPFFKANYAVGCKTGTAQQGGETALPHAWFTVYAPAEKPVIALTVMLEHAGQGSEVAAPIAKKAIDYWMNKK